MSDATGCDGMRCLGDDKTTAEHTIADRTVPFIWKISPVTDLSIIEVLPPAARDREIKVASDTFASTGRNIFVHYVTPILAIRRKDLLESGITKKKYPKTSPQLWQTIGHDESFFWNEAAREIRLCLKKQILSRKECLIRAGRLSEREAYIFHAEIAVASYLNLQPPQLADETQPVASQGEAVQPKTLSDPICHIQSLKDLQLSSDCKETPVAINTPVGTDYNSDQQLLDTLPDRFEYEQRMMYGSFAKYDYDEVRNAEGKHQIAMLRQLANLFDQTGRILFYYYVVPRLCKDHWPPSTGETVNSKAADIWRFLPGAEKQKWLTACLTLKKLLGDGNIVALETLQLDSLEPEVLELHDLAKAVIEFHHTKSRVE